MDRERIAGRRSRTDGPRHRPGPRRDRPPRRALRTRARPGRRPAATGSPATSIGRSRRAASTAEERDAILDRIEATDDLAAAARRRPLVEAVFEDVGIKTRLWAELDGIAPAGAIFATNTSSISIDRLAAAVGEERRTRFIGMHFFSPVPVMPLVELIRGIGDERRDGRRGPGLAGDMGKQVIASADRPGLHRQPDPDAVPRRGDAGLRGGPRDGRGHRHRGEGRPEPPDGPARARRLHRPRRLPRGHGGPARRASGRSTSRRRRCSGTSSTAGISARRRAAASTPTRAAEAPAAVRTRAPPATAPDELADRRDVERLGQQLDAAGVGELAELRVQDVAAHEREPPAERRIDRGDRRLELDAVHAGHPVVARGSPPAVAVRTISRASAPLAASDGLVARRATGRGRGTSRIDGSSSSTSTRAAAAPGPGACGRRRHRAARPALARRTRFGPVSPRRRGSRPRPVDRQLDHEGRARRRRSARGGSSRRGRRRSRTRPTGRGRCRRPAAWS